MDRANHTRRDRTKLDPGTDLAGVDLDGVSRGELGDRLTEQLRTAILAGRIVAGSALPSSRLLAEQLAVSRGVVTDAYGRLTDEGLVQGRGRTGTIVQHVRRHTGPPFGPDAPLRPRTPASEPGPDDNTRIPGYPSARIDPARRDAHRAPSTRIDTTQAAHHTMAARIGQTQDAHHEQSARIDLTPGRPDLASFPRAAWLRAEREVLRTTDAEALGYGDPQGAGRLRAAVAAWLARSRGLDVAADDVVITAGVAQGLALLGGVLRARGVSEVAVEDPGSAGVRDQLRAAGLAVPPIAVDADGLRVADLDAERAVLVTPAHQFPTGAVLGGARRRALLDWAAASDALVIEDDYDAEHRYDRHPVPALAGGDPAHVCYLGSVSKLLAPAIRIGWAVPPPYLRAALVAAKRDADLGNPTLPQLALAALMERGELERHIHAGRERHRRRRDALLDGLRASAPGVEVLGVAAGLHLTLRLPDPTDDEALAARLLDEHGIRVQPLSRHRQRPGFPGLVLGYATTPPGLLAEAGGLIGGALPR